MARDQSTQPVHVPKDALSRVHIGHSFAEFDLVRDNPHLIVQTNAIRAALSSSRTKCFFVGRRGTGKTAITFAVANKSKRTIRLVPELLAPRVPDFKIDDFRDPKQRPFKTLWTSFRRAIYGVVLEEWKNSGLLETADVPRPISKEFRSQDHDDFDLHLLHLFESNIAHLKAGDDRGWLKEVKHEKALVKAMEAFREDREYDYTVMIDSIDESWDGTEQSIVYLMALMHACVEIASHSQCIRPLLFVRENVFDRVREVDSEFARLETWLVSLEWSSAELLEMIERRLNRSLTAKLPLRGPTWDHFFEGIQNNSSWEGVVDFCQHRPRDVLTYTEFAIEIAQSNRRAQVTIEDMQTARRRFADNRLKDLGDEYSENYPNVAYVLSCFHGLGRTFTLNGLTAVVQKLITDLEIQKRCTWFFDFTAPERLAELLYNIGFVGLLSNGTPRFRGFGSSGSKAPAITSSTRIIVHPTYAEALSLQDVIVDSLGADVELQQAGVVAELPGALSADEYYAKLVDIQETIKMLEPGREDAEAFEDVVGDVIEYCFFQWLGNVEEKVRDVGGTAIRDWVAANIATGGFWEAMRQRYNAVSVVWECKNYEELKADDFHQANYYAGALTGLIIIAYRGEREKKKRYYEHIRNVSSKNQGNAIVLLVNDQDLLTFVRQAIRGKFRDSHIREVYDATARAIG